MRRLSPRTAALFACGGLLALGGCKGKPAEPAPPAEATAAAPVPAASAAGGQADEDYGTPVKDRVATLGLLNKRNNLTQDIQLKSGEAKRIGNVIVKLGTCERTKPWEDPPETGAFVQVFVEERATIKDRLAWHKVFSGWLFKNSPSLNVVEHPVYDVWVKDCSMKFPGEDAQPPAAASASNAAKPSGSASAAPAPTAAQAAASGEATAAGN
ncbi:MAG: DUF2155 domain-containing protein [Sphingomonadales bacterium]|nr:DUF2155 domain-containing protein [Sphingomonadales bacterium]MDE2568839.1 DUF2155 domain-containing protein [Sphingomonadales bacterium]